MNMEFSGGLFEMRDPSGVIIGRSSDVIGTMSIDMETGTGVAEFSSEETFYGSLWVAHDIVVQMTSAETMKVNMLFDWGSNTNIEVTVYMGLEFNTDGSAVFTTLDTDGDDIPGYPMDGSSPFSGFSAAFSGLAIPIANSAPIAHDERLKIDESAVTIIDVLSNDTDADGDNLTVTFATAEEGSVSINEDGTLTYTANQKFNGIDSITYMVSDGNGGTDTAIVKLLIKASSINFEDQDSFESDISGDGDNENWHEVELVGGEKYSFSLEASNIGVGKLKNAYIELRDEFGEIVDKYNGLGDSVLALVAPGEIGLSSKYYLVIQSRNAEEIGSYKIISRNSDDHGASREEATSIDFDNVTDSVSISGGIQWKSEELDDVPEELKEEIPGHDEDWLSIVLDKDDEKQFVTFDLESIGSGDKLKKATVEIFDPDNNLVARASGKDLDDGSASITLQALSTGNYTIRVTDKSGSTGDYQLTATKTFAPEDKDFDHDFEDDVEVSDSVLEVDNDVVKAKGDLTFLVGAPDIKESREDVGSHGSFSVDKSTKKYEFTPNEAIKALILSGDKSVEISSVDALDLYIPRSTYKYKAAKTETEYFQIELDDGTVKTMRVEIKETKDVSHSAKHDEVIRVGDIGVSGDIDVHSISVIEGNSYFVEVVSVVDGITAPLKEAKMTLEGVEITLSKSDGNMASNMPSVIFEANESGSVLVNVRARTDIDAGQYAVRVIDLGEDGGDDAIDQVSDYNSTISSMLVGDSQYGSLENSDDVDIIAVNLVADQKTTIEVTSQGSLTATRVEILNSTGEVVYSGKSGRDLVAQVNAQVEETGIYFIKINNARVENNKGDYLINIIDQSSVNTGDWVVSSSFGVGEGDATSQWYKDSGALNIGSLGGEFTGSGVTIAVVDSGVDYNHSALNGSSFISIENTGLNSWAKYENDVNSGMYSEETGQHDVWNVLGLESSQLNEAYHGSRVAGIIAGDSKFGTVENTDGVDFLGLSPGAVIHSWYRGDSNNTIATAHSINPLNYGITETNYAQSIDISNNSWNYGSAFSDNFLDLPGTATGDLGTSILEATDAGTIFVFSAGNGRSTGDNVNYHNLTNSPLTIAVASVDQDNLSSSWSSTGSAVLVAAYGDNIYTTDISEYHLTDPKYVASSGTSFAAPEVSAIIALMLEANPTLGYRDVQAILAHSAVKSNHIDDPADYWQYNQGSAHNLGGMHFNDEMGFGIVNPYTAVRLAESWSDTGNGGSIWSSGSGEVYTSGEISYGVGQLDVVSSIPDASTLTKILSIGDNIEIEHVVLKVGLDHDYLNDVTIQITSPDGLTTTSTLMDSPSITTSTNLEFEFSSVQFYGENALGDWTVTITDNITGHNPGTLNSLKLTVYGSPVDGNDQYIFTDEFTNIGIAASDSEGTDWINTSAVTSDISVDLFGSQIDFLDEAGVSMVTQDLSPLSSIHNVVTGDGDDFLAGNILINDLDGGRGSDTAIYANPLELGVNYSVTFNADHVLVETLNSLNASVIEDTDRLYSIESLSFGGDLYSISATGFINTIQTDANKYLDNVSLNYFENEVDTGISTLVEGGNITLPVSSLSFDAIKLSDPATYDSDGIQADDAVDILLDVVGLDSLEIGSAAWHAADVNNNGAIQADDAVAVLRHIVGLSVIDTFDLVGNTTGNRMTSLSPDTESQYSIVANGDVDQSGIYDTPYIVDII